MADIWSSLLIRRKSTTSPAVERGSETELLAAALSSLGRCAAGSFVRNEPELVSVEGVFTLTFGGVNPLTDIGDTTRVDNTPRNNAGV